MNPTATTVSVLIATYNSARFIAETLDSVYNQRYEKIELVVSDDCSTDDTRDICQHWAAQYGHRFTRVVLIKTPRNLGISGNYNHALAQASGEWIKCLDSDDLLHEDCIATFVNASKKRKEIHAWYSGWEQICEDGTVFRRDRNDFPSSTARKQLRSYLLHIQDIHTNTLFVRTSTLRKIGGFDMRYPMTQDIPLIYNLLLAGNTFGILPDDYTIRFRHVMDSVSRSSNPIMCKNIAECRYYYARYFLRYGLVFHWYNAFVTHFINHHHEGVFAKSAGYMLRAVDVVHWYYKTVQSSSKE